MSTSKLTAMDTTLSEETITLTGRAEPCHVGGGKLACHVDTDGGYSGMTTTIILVYLADGGTCPANEICLGISGGKAIYVKSVSTE